MRAELTIALDGHPVTLVDLSSKGAQVLSTLPLRPNQRVRLSLPQAVRPLRTGAIVVWANFEMPSEGARFRAGLAFSGVDVDALARFIDAHRRQDS
jgi:hypothetical protein